MEYVYEVAYTGPARPFVFAFCQKGTSFSCPSHYPAQSYSLSP